MKTLALAFAAATILAGPAAAQSVAALVGDDTLAIVDVGAKKVTKSMKVTGIAGKLHGIDVRPADGMLYGLVSDGSVVTIDTATGKATVKSKLDNMLPAGVAGTIDFNPVADRMRVIGADGSNLRVNVDDGKTAVDGKLKFADTDMHKGETPKVVAAAYTNSVKGAKETTLYDVDATIGALLKQAPPNDGVLNAVGKFGVSAKNWAFDIASTGESNTGWLMGDDTLYSVDLATGKATSVGKIAGVTGVVHKITLLPKM